MDIYASDEEKAEAIKQWWRDNGRSVVVGVVLGIASIFGFRYWMTHQQTQSEQAAVLYQQTIIAINTDNGETAKSSAETLMKNYQSNAYATFAAIELAKLEESKGNFDAAQDYLKWVNTNADLDSYKQLALLRLARLYFEQASYDDALNAINTASTSAFASLFSELKGDVELAMGNQAEAYVSYKTARNGLNSGEPRDRLLEIKMADVAASDEG
ncbi:MAG TPA: tetratricopeptide repeat protein [Methylophaga aminisulfidivorans]|uniref:Ancillary SecYEG translocon subunit n=2 Tax=root TaxID=1 RepID=A0A7C1W1B4_9GAMM|nr:tetratricopeptide repeat protein [Methylophaga aminisulfidivorans]